MERAATQPSTEPCCVFKQQQERCTKFRKVEEPYRSKKLLHFSPDSFNGPEPVALGQTFRC